MSNYMHLQKRALNLTPFVHPNQELCSLYAELLFYANDAIELMLWSSCTGISKKWPI